MIKAGRLNGPNRSPKLVVPLQLTNLSKSYHFANTLAQNKCILQSSTDSVTYIKTQMYDIILDLCLRSTFCDAVVLFTVWRNFRLLK